MESIKLNKSQFAEFNDCDSQFIFKEKMDQAYASTPDEEKDHFSFDYFIDQETEKLFTTYDHVIVTEDDKIYGVSGSDVVFLSEFEYSYECALSVIIK